MASECAARDFDVLDHLRVPLGRFVPRGLVGLRPPRVTGPADVPRGIDGMRDPSVVDEIEFRGEPGCVAVVDEPRDVVEERRVGPLLHTLADPVALPRDAQRMGDHDVDVHEVHPGVGAQFGQGSPHLRAVGVVVDDPGEVRVGGDLRVEKNATPVRA